MNLKFAEFWMLTMRFLKDLLKDYSMVNEIALMAFVLFLLLFRHC